MSVSDDIGTVGELEIMAIHHGCVQSDADTYTAAFWASLSVFHPHQSYLPSMAHSPTSPLLQRSV